MSGIELGKVDVIKQLELKYSVPKTKNEVVLSPRMTYES
jgi:hypothetical protein